MTDAIYADYGGDATLGTDKQRSAAYFIAERQLSEDLETYLLPTIVTGTYLYRPRDRFLILENAWVRRVIKTSFIAEQEKVYWSQSGTDNVYISLRDPERGLLDVRYLMSICHCGTNSTPYPYQVRVVHEAGLSSGTTYRDDILLALTTYVSILMNEIIGYGNEAPGDIGVQDYSNQSYQETRVKLYRTSFGSSPRADFVKKLIEKYRKKRYVGMSL